MLEEDVVLLRATEPPCLSALHAKHNTTNPFGYKLGESTENNKALFSQVWKQFKLLTVNRIVLFNGFLSDFVKIASYVYTKTIIL